ncbi:hypothetical protein ACOMHN_005916 [Nucella lapillus]
MKDSNWHSGPEFLKHDPVVSEVPEVAVASHDTEVKVYPTKVKYEKGRDCEEIIKRFSSLDRLFRVAACLLSWLRQARKKRTKQEILVPSSSESQDLAFKQIIIGVQTQHFPLSQRSTHHELRRLDVFTDHQGMALDMQKKDVRLLQEEDRSLESVRRCLTRPARPDAVAVYERSDGLLYRSWRVFCSVAIAPQGLRPTPKPPRELCRTVPRPKTQSGNHTGQG